MPTTSPIEPETYAKAMLNILADLGDEKVMAQDTELALLNILGDAAEDKEETRTVQTALLNVLEDSAAERVQLESTQKAFLNILGDAADDKEETRTVQTALLNVLEDSAAERLQLEATQRAFLNIMDDFDIEKGKVNRINAELVVEIAQRKTAEKELEDHKLRLEDTVAARTLELKRTNENLLAANKELEGFSYETSHVLLAPLRAMDGFAGILSEEYGDKLDDEGKRVLGVVRSSARELSALVDGILGFLRLGREELRPAPINMDDLARLALEGLKQKTDSRAIDIEIGPLPDTVGDAAMIWRVWTNLLENAAKFTAPRTNAKIELGAMRGESETIYFVRDNGVGFDMRFAAKLFGVFRRLHNTEFSGHGLGLAIVQRVVARHGGRIWAEAKPDEGATFYFSLPKQELNHG
jgi:signal transduction histidine kinase